MAKQLPRLKVTLSWLGLRQPDRNVNGDDVGRRLTVAKIPRALAQAPGDASRVKVFGEHYPSCGAPVGTANDTHGDLPITQ